MHDAEDDLPLFAGTINDQPRKTRNNQLARVRNPAGSA
jgi:hypothetical protein